MLTPGPMWWWLRVRTLALSELHAWGMALSVQPSLRLLSCTILYACTRCHS